MLRQHFFAVLAQHRRGAPHLRRGRVQVDRIREVGHLAGDRVREMEHRAGVLDLRVGRQRGVVVLHQRARHVGLGQGLDPPRRRVFDKLVFQDAVELVPVRRALGVAGEALVGDEFGPADGAAQVVPEFVGEAGGKEVRAVRTFVVAVRHHRRVAAAQARRRLAAAQGFAVARDGAEQRRGEQRGVELLAHSGAFAVQQRGDDAECEHGRGAEVGQRCTHPHRQPAGFTGHVHQAGHRLDDRVVGRPGRIRPGLTEGRRAGIDDLRVDLEHRGVANAQAIHRAGAEVLDDHIGVLRQAQEHGAAGRGLQVQAQAAFVPVLRQELHALAAHELVAEIARQVAALGLLDLDHIGAQVAEQHRADRARGHHAQVEDDVAAEGKVFDGIAHELVFHD